jgi:hypothetical protein
MRGIEGGVMLEIHPLKNKRVLKGKKIRRIRPKYFLHSGGLAYHAYPMYLVNIVVHLPNDMLLRLHLEAQIHQGIHDFQW